LNRTFDLHAAFLYGRIGNGLGRSTIIQPSEASNHAAILERRRFYVHSLGSLQTQHLQPARPVYRDFRSAAVHIIADRDLHFSWPAAQTDSGIRFVTERILWAKELVKFAREYA
jgi:hypothetical protein